MTFYPTVPIASRNSPFEIVKERAADRAFLQNILVTVAPTQPNAQAHSCQNRLATELKVIDHRHPHRISCDLLLLCNHPLWASHSWTWAEAMLCRV